MIAADSKQEPRRAALLHMRRVALALVPWLALVLMLALDSVWQWWGRAHQRVDVGTPLDAGYVLFFHAPERGATDAGLTFRWSRPSSELRLVAPPRGAPAILSLRLMAPPQPDGPQRLSLAIDGGSPARVTNAPTPRVYRFLAPAPDSAELSIKLESPRLQSGADTRDLGFLLDSFALDAPGGPAPWDLLRELWAAPFLPQGLLLLAVCGLLLRSPLLMGGLPALGLAGLALLDRGFHTARLLLASYLFAAAVVAVTALALAALIQRAPRLWPADDRRALRWIIVVFAITLAATFTPLIKNDGVEYYAYLRSLTMDGDLQFANEYSAPVFPRVPDLQKLPPTVTGHIPNLASVGPALAWSPLYGVAHLLVIGGRALGVPWRADGYDAPYIVLSTFTSALAGLVIMLAGYRICRRWVGPGIATLAVTSALLGSNLLYYTMREGSFAHALSAAATLYLLAWLRLEERPGMGRWGALGAAAGAMVVMYWISALVLLLPAFTFARLLRAALRGPADRRGQELRRLALGGAAAIALLLLVVGPQLLAWKVVYGSFLAVPHGGDYIRPRSFQGLQLLFAHLYGLLPWTPALFAGLVGLPLLWRRDRWLTLGLALAFLLYFWYNASLMRWFAGGSFGLRRITVLTPWFLIGLALLYDAIGRWRAIAPIALAALMGGWTTLLLVRYDLFLIPHVPEEIDAMPALSFYLDRDTLPVWALPGWLRNGYFVTQVRASLSPADTGAFIALVAVMVLATWAVVACFRRLGWRQSEITPRGSPARSASLFGHKG